MGNNEQTFTDCGKIIFKESTNDKNPRKYFPRFKVNLELKKRSEMF